MAQTNKGQKTKPPEEEKIDPVAEESVTEAVVEPPADPPAPDQPPVKREKSAPKYTGPSVYIGPSISSLILCGTVFPGDKDTTLAELGKELEKHPLIASLIVPAALLAESRIKVQSPGNLLHVNYMKLARATELKQGGNPHG